MHVHNEWACEHSAHHIMNCSNIPTYNGDILCNLTMIIFNQGSELSEYKQQWILLMPQLLQLLLSSTCKTRVRLTLRGTLLTCRYFQDVPAYGATDHRSATHSLDGQAVNNDNELAYIAVVVVVVVTGCELRDNIDSDDRSARRPRIIVHVSSDVTDC